MSNEKIAKTIANVNITIFIVATTFFNVTLPDWGGSIIEVVILISVDVISYVCGRRLISKVVYETLNALDKGKKQA